MLKVISLFAVGLVVGMMFTNAKFENTEVVKSQTEVVYGTRIGPSGQLMTLTSK